MRINFFKKTKHKKPRPESAGAIFVLFVLLFVSAALITFIFVFNSRYQDKIIPNTWMGSLDIGGLDYRQVRLLLEEQDNSFADQGLAFNYQNEEFFIKSVVGDPANPELSTRLFSYDIDKTLDKIKSVQRSHSEAEKIFYWLSGQVISPIVEIDEDKMIESLDERLGQYEQPAVNAALEIDEEYNISITSEKGGQAFNYEKINKMVVASLELFSKNPIKVVLEKDNPEITRISAEPVLGLVEQVIAATPFILIYDEYAWAIEKEQVRDWLEFVYENNGPTVGFNQDKITEYLSELADIIDVEVKEAKFTMENGKVLEFQPSQNGRTLIIDRTISNINEKIRQVGITEIDLVVDEVEPEVTTENVNNLGIKELIGEGRSNFKGSPANRRHNISVGANTLNGLLIKPGEEFSLVGALGEIEASTGYLPELVIKGNKTIPEYGGGLCQIGTTAFRAALDAGFPITARKNHSYRVSYYEPAGTDATIYDPNPDFKFINDTGYHVLFTTEIDGDELIFRFYGTSDGRRVEQTKPRIYNYVRPGPTKLVETTDLAPGQKKCTERAHTGADTEFTRTITYADGEQKVDTFRSHYKPWQEVCLIGVEELSEEAGT